MRQILLAGLAPNTGEWLAYRLRGETVEVLFRADDLIERLEEESTLSLVVLSACGAVDGVERDVARVRAACGPAVPLVVEVDSGHAAVSPGFMGRLMHEHGVRRIVPSSASRAELLGAILAFLPDAARPAPAPRVRPDPAVPLRRFPDRFSLAAPIGAPGPVSAHRVAPPPPRLDVPFGGRGTFALPAQPRIPDASDDLVLMDTSVEASLRRVPARIAASAVEPDPPLPRQRVLVVSADPDLYDAFAAAGTEYDARVGTFGELLRMEPDDAPAAVVVDVPAGQGERVWRILDRIGRRLPRVPVLVATASDGLDDRVNAVRVGAIACIQKPVPAATAREVLARAVPPRESAVPRVLVVDDDEEVLRSADELFRRLGWEVRTVAEPEAVWEALASTRPDLLILDAELPGMDGLDLCRAVRSDPRWRRLPVLFLTATTEVPWLYRAYAAGADDHVAKPFWGPELVSRARNRLRRLELSCV